MRTGDTSAYMPVSLPIDADSKRNKLTRHAISADMFSKASRIASDRVLGGYLG